MMDQVSLRKESVDRNFPNRIYFDAIEGVALRKGERG